MRPKVINFPTYSLKNWIDMLIIDKLDERLERIDREVKIDTRLTVPKITCVTTVYNDAKFVRQAMESVLAQNYPNLEYIVVDDGSCDRSSDIVNSIANNNADVRVIQQANSGLSHARNRALKLMTGDYVTFVDSDDLKSLGSFQAVAQQIEQYSPDVIFTRAEVLTDDGRSHPFYDKEIFDRLLERQNHESGFQPNPFACISLEPQMGNKFIRVDLLKQLGLNFPSQYIFEDLPFMSCLLMVAPKCSLVDTVSLYYRDSRRPRLTSSISRSRFDIIANYHRVLYFYKNIFNFDPNRDLSYIHYSFLRMLDWSFSYLNYRERQEYCEQLVHLWKQIPESWSQIRDEAVVNAQGETLKTLDELLRAGEVRKVLDLYLY
jgi:glycosyltransferase involved in cell wall biosynthesis